MVEFKKGDFVVPTWGAIKDVMKIALKPKVKYVSLHLTLEDRNGKRIECLAQWWRLATKQEIDSGCKL